MNYFLKSIIQLGIFMICAQTIVHFRPNGSYEKYLKMLVSIMILLQVFWPILNLFTSDAEGIEERIRSFGEEMAGSMGNANGIIEETDSLFYEMSLEEIRKRIEEERMEEERMEEKSVEEADEQEKKGQAEERKESEASVIHIDKIEVDLEEEGSMDGEDKKVPK